MLISSFLVVIFNIGTLRFNKAFDEFFESVAVARRVLANIGPAEGALARFQQGLKETLVAVSVPAIGRDRADEELEADGARKVVVERSHCFSEY